MGSPNRLRASIVDLTFITWAAAVPLALQSRLLNADGDFARHVRMGEFILRGGPWQVDDLAFTHTGPFLTTEWLSQVAFALAHAAGGIAAVVALCGLVVGLAYALVAAHLRTSGVDAFLAYSATTVAAVLGSPHWLARPHVFTFLGLAVLLNLTRTPRRWWVYALFFGVWANFHAGFVVGLALLAGLSAGEWLESRLEADASIRSGRIHQARALTLGLAAGGLATLVNPLGPGLWMRVGGVLSNGFILSQTAEFQSLDFHSGYGRVALLVFLSIVALLALRPRRPALPNLFVLLILLAGALISRRNFPLFALVVIPMLATEFDGDWRRLHVPGLERIRGVFEAGERVAVPGRWAPGFAGLLLLLGLNGGSVAGTRLIVADFDPDRFPVTAVKAARDAGLQGRIFSHETWGGYMLYAWPEQKIFMDGMTDFFGVGLMQTYLRIMRLDTGWEAELDRYRVDMVLVQPHTRLAGVLRDRPDWETWYHDETAILLRRRADGGAVAGR